MPVPPDWSLVTLLYLLKGEQAVSGSGLVLIVKLYAATSFQQYHWCSRNGYQWCSGRLWSPAVNIQLLVDHDVCVCTRVIRVCVTHTCVLVLSNTCNTSCSSVHVNQNRKTSTSNPTGSFWKQTSPGPQHLQHNKHIDQLQVHKIYSKNVS